jgi:hypothetical protein
LQRLLALSRSCSVIITYLFREWHLEHQFTDFQANRRRAGDRTTHPLVSEHFRKFFSAAVQKPVEVGNPFVWKTKSDVVQSIVDHGCGN